MEDIRKAWKSWEGFPSEHNGNADEHSGLGEDFHQAKIAMVMLSKHPLKANSATGEWGVISGESAV